VYKHDANCITPASPFCTCLPPADRIDDEYLCRPAPKQKCSVAPPIGPRKLTHCLLSPQCIKPEQESVLAQLPKRVGLHGELKATPQDEVIGWGLHFEEGWHWPTIWFVFSLFVLFSLLFGVIWSVMRKDIQGGFAVAAFVLTSCSLLGGFIFYEIPS
jgi:hypothetical protein